KGESYGLLIDAIGEVLKLPAASREDNPVNLDARLARVSAGVHRLGGSLLVVLDVDRVLEVGGYADAAWTPTLHGMGEHQWPRGSVRRSREDKMKTCLVVDDSSVIRKVARRILEGLEFEIAEAEDGEQALEACRASMPDAVLLDWNMPKMD